MLYDFLRVSNMHQEEILDELENSIQDLLDKYLLSLQYTITIANLSKEAIRNNSKIYGIVYTPFTHKIYNAFFGAKKLSRLFKETCAKNKELAEVLKKWNDINKSIFELIYKISILDIVLYNKYRQCALKIIEFAKMLNSMHNDITDGILVVDVSVQGLNKSNYTILDKLVKSASDNHIDFDKIVQFSQQNAHIEKHKIQYLEFALRIYGLFNK